MSDLCILAIREELDSMWSKDPSRPAEQKWNDIKSELKKSDSKTKKTVCTLQISDSTAKGRTY